MGMCAAAVMNAIGRYLLFQMMNNTLNYYLSNNAIVIGLLVGFLIPMASNIIPIQQALGKNLRQSLDMNRSTKNDI